MPTSSRVFAQTLGHTACCSVFVFNNIKIYYDIREKAAGGTGPMIETYSYPSFLEMMDPDEKQ